MTFARMKPEHRHKFEEVTDTALVYVQGSPQKQIIKIKKCTLEGCQYKEAYDLVRS